MTRALALVALLLAGCAGAPAKVAPALPDRTLEAPDGRRHSTAALAARGAVCVVAPATLSTSTTSATGARTSTPRGAGRARSCSSRTSGRAGSRTPSSRRCASSTTPRGGVVMLIDPEGALREALGVEEGDVVVLVYSAERRLLLTLPGPPTREAAASPGPRSPAAGGAERSPGPTDSPPPPPRPGPPAPNAPRTWR